MLDCKNMQPVSNVATITTATIVQLVTHCVVCSNVTQWKVTRKHLGTPIREDPYSPFLPVLSVSSSMHTSSHCFMDNCHLSSMPAFRDIFP